MAPTSRISILLPRAESPTITSLPLPAPTFSFNTDKVIVLLVGEDEQKLTVHEDYITRNSEFFATALKKAWVEGQTRTVKLPSKTSLHMVYYLDFIYTGKLPTDVYNARIQATRHKSTFLLLAQLYVLGERMLDKAFRNALLREKVHFKRLPNRNLAKGWTFSPSITTINIIYRGTTTGSPARRLLVDTCLAFGRNDWFSMGAEKEFLFDMTTACFSKLIPGAKDVPYRMIDLQWENYQL